MYNVNNVKDILKECNKILNNFEKNFYIDETQIIIQNSINLNCNRHFKVFNEFNIIPKYCFSCYKIQISLFNIIDLIKLYFIFDNLNFKKNNIRKCMVETRENIKGNYKGFIYCKGLNEAQTIINEINLVLKIKIFQNSKLKLNMVVQSIIKNTQNIKKLI